MNKKILSIIVIFCIIGIGLVLTGVFYKSSVLSSYATITTCVDVNKLTETFDWAQSDSYTCTIPAGQSCDVTWTLEVAGLTKFEISSADATDSPKSASNGGSAIIHSYGITEDTQATVKCTASSGCVAGYTILSTRSCETSCSDECSSSGLTRCSGENEQTCGNYDTDECLEWSVDDDCSDCSCTCGGYGKSSETGYCSDGKDNDCGGGTDSEDSDCPTGGDDETGCTDSDGDGYGIGTGLSQCSGSIFTPDCDDSDSEVYPGASELCDGIDNNCDGTIDEGCECDPAPEVCNDKKDNDCDGKVDCNDPDCENTEGCKDVPPEITLKIPVDEFVSTDGEIDFIYIASDERDINFCSLVVNDEIVASDISIPNEELTYFNSTGLGDGEYTWRIECQDTGGNDQTSETRTFTVKLKDPQKINIKPIFITSDETEVEEVTETGAFLSALGKDKTTTILVIIGFTIFIIVIMAAVKSRKVKAMKAVEQPAPKK